MCVTVVDFFLIFFLAALTAPAPEHEADSSWTQDGPSFQQLTYWLFIL